MVIMKVRLCLALIDGLIWLVNVWLVVLLKEEEETKLVVFSERVGTESCCVWITVSRRCDAGLSVILYGGWLVYNNVCVCCRPDMNGYFIEPCIVTYTLQSVLDVHVQVFLALHLLDFV